MEMGIHVARLVTVFGGVFIPELFLLNRKGKTLFLLPSLLNDYYVLV